tara:strand:+ start:80 stop:355 length:276 start_codon:yes stop_codon:yes gene_type:complete
MPKTLTDDEIQKILYSLNQLEENDRRHKEILQSVFSAVYQTTDPYDNKIGEMIAQISTLHTELDGYVDIKDDEKVGSYFSTFFANQDEVVE